jgi:RNA polymerase primary sigma factor
MEDKNIINLYINEVKKEKINKNLCYEKARTDLTMFNNIVKSHLAFVVKISKKYCSKDFPLEDVVQEGNIGLIEAIKRFNPERNVKFSVYAIWWIKYYIFLAVKKKAISLPYNREKHLTALNKQKEILQKKLERQPTTHELACQLNFNDEYINRLEKINYKYVSYETLESYDLIDKSYNTLQVPELRAEIFLLQKELTKILNRIDKKKADIIKLIYGICGENQLDIKEIAERFNFSTARIRQIKKYFSELLQEKYDYLKDFI